MYKNIEDFIIDWKEEASNTIRVFGSINDDLMNKKVNKNVRSLGRIAWHITQTLTEMPARAKIIPEDILENKHIPENFKTLIKIYSKHSEELVSLIKKNWKDSELEGRIELYNQKWKRNKVLSILIKHQIHHRAQMTIIMRLLNIEIPGIYGPTKEEWTKFGMKPHE